MSGGPFVAVDVDHVDLFLARLVRYVGDELAVGRDGGVFLPDAARVRKVARETLVLLVGGDDQDLSPAFEKEPFAVGRYSEGPRHVARIDVVSPRLDAVGGEPDVERGHLFGGEIEDMELLVVVEDDLAVAERGILDVVIAVVCEPFDIPVFVSNLQTFSVPS